MPPPVSADQASRTVLSARFQDSSMCGRSEQGRRALALVAAAAALAALAPGRAAAAGAGAVENALPPPNDMQRLWEELGNVKTMMSGISDELSRFNTLYLGKLEHRMLAIATALSSVDSNVKNLQERAHVWDTFQLHVAAWNEQIKTLDKKVDILSRGHEKLDVMDGKLSALQALDYKVERVAGRVGEAEARLAALARSLDAHRDAHRDSYALFGDVAARGVVSTLRIIERKVDRLQVGLTHIKNHEGHGGGGGGGGGRGGGKGGGKNSSGNRSGGGGAAAWGVEAEDGGPASVAALGRGKLIIRCNAPAALEELVRDVAAKVDVMFDKMAAAAGPGGEGAEALVASEPPAPRLAHIHVSELRDLAENKMLERLWRRLTSPFKRTARALEALEGAVRAAANASAAAQHQSAADAAQAARCCAAADRRLEQLLDAARAHDARLDRLARLAPATCDPARADDRGAAASGNASSRAEEPPPTPPSLPTPPGTSGEEADSGGGDGDGAGSGDGEAEPEGAAEGEGAVEPPFIPVVARNCEDLLGGGGGGGRPRASGVYKLGGHDLNPKGRDFYTRYCDMHTNGGGWTVIQRRGNFHGRRQKFSLPWKDYKRGFGDLDKEFWFGNDFIHRLTYQKDMVLRIELEAFSGKRAWAEYSSFRVGAAESNYRLTVGGYSGNATDSLQVHDGASFSTADKTNDAAPACCPCAPAYGGGWWFDSCFEANLNGVYFTPKDHREEFRGIIWEHWLGDESLKATEMKIRPKTVTGAIIREDPGFDEHGSSVDDVDPLDIPEDP